MPPSPPPPSLTSVTPLKLYASIFSPFSHRCYRHDDDMPAESSTKNIPGTVQIIKPKKGVYSTAVQQYIRIGSPTGSTAVQPSYTCDVVFRENVLGSVLGSVLRSVLGPVLGSDWFSDQIGSRIGPVLGSVPRPIGPLARVRRGRRRGGILFPILPHHSTNHTSWVVTALLDARQFSDRFSDWIGSDRWTGSQIFDWSSRPRV